MKKTLGNSDKAIIDRRKFTEYCLNPNSPKGKHKARVFKAALGYDIANCADLIRQIRAGISVHTAEFVCSLPHGDVWRVDIPIQGPAGKAVVRTGWIYGEGKDVARLTTAFVLS